MSMENGFPGNHSSDNYRSLQTDSICQANGHEPTSLAMIAPAYLGDVNRQTSYDVLRKIARRP